MEIGMNRTKAMIRGAIACRDGYECDPGECSNFKIGYAQQYEQLMKDDNKTVEQAKEMELEE